MKRNGFKKFLITGALATGLLAPTNALADDIFLKLGDIKGESTDDKHPDEIDVMSWSWGQSNGSAVTGKGAAPKVCIQDLYFVKPVDASSGALIMKSMLGEVIPEATLVVRKGGERALEYVKLTMKNVKVTSFQTGGSAGGSTITDQVSLRFESMQFEYRKQSDTGASVPLTFDIVGGNSGGCR